MPLSESMVNDCSCSLLRPHDLQGCEFDRNNPFGHRNQSSNSVFYKSECGELHAGDCLTIWRYVLQFQAVIHRIMIRVTIANRVFESC
jgi:hypothetical protein